ncbi:MAG: GNAT family N-acetyltransferase [Bdellovibrionales bacterium]|nr:GNAT family N-acetyltransferase [Bdellovibrionales bacterium]
MIEIRLLQASDTSDFFNHRLEGLKVISSAFGGSYEDEVKNGPDRYQTILEKQDHSNVILGAFTDGKLVGCVGLFQEVSTKARHKAVIWGMFVKSSAQGKGIGKKLMVSAITHAKTIKEIQLINLSAESTNQAAKGLYESMGFRTWGVEPKAIELEGKFYDEDHMILEF